MPYEVSFTKRVPVLHREQYINECCIGGDVVLNHLLPSVRARYADVQTNQEDWGWFIWFRKGHVRLAIDVFTDDPEQGFFGSTLRRESNACSCSMLSWILPNWRNFGHWWRLN